MLRRPAPEVKASKTIFRRVLSILLGLGPHRSASWQRVHKNVMPSPRDSLRFPNLTQG